VTRLSGSTAFAVQGIISLRIYPMVRASSRSEKLPSRKPHALEHKIRFRNLSKRYTFAVKKRPQTAGSGEEGCAGLVSCPASDASIDRMRTRFLDAGKTEPCAHNFNVEFKFRPTWPGTRITERAIPQQAISARKKTLMKATSTGREQHECWFYACISMLASHE